MANHQHLSCVLLAQPTPLIINAIAESYRELFPEGVILVDATSNENFTELRTGPGSTTYVASMPAPVPGGEAESHCPYSLECLLGARPIESHGAHILVITRCEAPIDAESMKVHLRNAAAVAKAHEAIGIYLGGCGVTHNADYFIEQVQSDDLPAAVLTGISLANEAGGRLSILTRGLRHFDIEEFFVDLPSANMIDGIDFVLNLVNYVVGCGKQMADGDTLTYGDSERVQVTYETSPFDPAEQVACVSLP